MTLREKQLTRLLCQEAINNPKFIIRLTEHTKYDYANVVRDLVTTAYHTTNYIDTLKSNISQYKCNSNVEFEVIYIFQNIFNK